MSSPPQPPWPATTQEPPILLSGYSSSEQPPVALPYDAVEDNKAAMTAVPLEYPCHFCKTSKVKCEKIQPCARCIRLNLECRPQTRGIAGGVLKLHKTRTQLDAQIPSSSSSSPSLSVVSTTSKEEPPHDSSGLSADMSPVKTRSRTGVRPSHKKKHSPGAASTTTSSMSSSNSSASSSSHRELVQFHHSTLRAPPMLHDFHLPHRAAESMRLTVLLMNNEGRLDETRTISLLSQTAMYNYRRNVDITLGVVNTLRGLVDQRSVSIPIGPPDPNLDTDLQVPDERTKFGTQFLPMYIKQLCDPVAAVAGFVLWNGEMTTFVNNRFATEFMSGDELAAKARTYGLLPLLLFSQIVDPDDMEQLYSSISEYAFSTPAASKEMACVVKCINKHGKRTRSLVRCRHVDITGGQCGASVFSIFPLPLPLSTSHQSPFRLTAEEPTIMDNRMLPIKTEMNASSSSSSSSGNSTTTSAETLSVISMPPPAPACTVTSSSSFASQEDGGGSSSYLTPPFVTPQESSDDEWVDDVCSAASLAAVLDVSVGIQPPTTMFTEQSMRMMPDMTTPTTINPPTAPTMTMAPSFNTTYLYTPPPPYPSVPMGCPPLAIALSGGMTPPTAPNLSSYGLTHPVPFTCMPFQVVPVTSSSSSSSSTNGPLDPLLVVPTPPGTNTYGYTPPQYLPNQSMYSSTTTTTAFPPYPYPYPQPIPPPPPPSCTNVSAPRPPWPHPFMFEPGMPPSDGPLEPPYKRPHPEQGP